MSDNPCKLGERAIPTGLSTLHGDEVCVHHATDHETQLVELRSVVEGEPMPEGAIGCMTRLDDGTYGPVPASHAGPARVTSEAYRVGWDRLFGGRHEVGRA